MLTEQQSTALRECREKIAHFNQTYQDGLIPTEEYLCKMANLWWDYNEVLHTIEQEPVDL